MNSLISKIKAIAKRPLIAVALLPLRILRLVLHMLYPIIGFSSIIAQHKAIKSWIDWIACIPFYIADILGIPELYEIVSELVFWRLRDIAWDERQAAELVFGNELQYDLIRINSHNPIAKGLKIAYVSFSHVNFFNEIPYRLLIHELVHVWQFHKVGSCYIYFALKAQYSKEGYNYGGKQNLVTSRLDGKDLFHFNFEQQGDIIEDIFCLYNIEEKSNINPSFNSFLDDLKQID